MPPGPAPLLPPPTPDSIPLRDAVYDATLQLAMAGVASPRFDAEALAAYTLGIERSQLWRHDYLPPCYRELVARRAAREPLQHITGVAYFRYLALAVGRGVFVPRPETELVAGAAIDEARRLVAADRRPVVVDLGTGSGAIALAVADEVREARVHAVEASPGAHAWAQRNVEALRERATVRLELGDMATAFRELDGTADVVVSNPPYVPLDAEPLDQEVRDHDPAMALWSGPDGLEAIRVVEQVAARLLRPAGLLVVEHADVQGEAVLALLRETGRWTAVEDHDDLAGRPRFTSARRSAVAPAAPVEDGGRTSA